MFQGIERAWQGDRESLALVRLAEPLEESSNEYVFPPALLDSCLQAVIPADREFEDRSGGLYLPHDIDSVRLYRRPGHRVWVHARLLEKTPERSISDVDIYDEDGMLAARVRGLRSHRVAGGLDRSLDDLLYAYEWRPQPRSEADVAPQELSWLILADRCGAGAQLARQLRAAGAPCTVVRPGGRFEACGDGQYQINPGRREDVLALFDSVLRRNPAPAGPSFTWETSTRRLPMS